MGILSVLSEPFAVVANWLLLVLPPRIFGAFRLGSADVSIAAALPAGRLWLDLTPSDVLVRTFSLGRANELRWRDHAAARLADYSPWKTDEFLWDGAVMGDNAEGGVTICVALTPLATLRDLEARAGRSFAAITLPALAERPRLVLRPDSQILRRLRRGLMVSSLGLIGLSVALTAWQLSGAVSANHAAQADESAAQSLNKAADRPATLGETALALMEDRTAGKTRSLILASLAKGLPVDSWASAIHVDEGGFVLSGVSPQPEAIVPLLEADPGLAQVQLSATSSRDPKTGLFSFSISGQGVNGESTP